MKRLEHAGGWIAFLAVSALAATPLGAALYNAPIATKLMVLVTAGAGGWAIALVGQRLRQRPPDPYDVPAIATPRTPERIAAEFAAKGEAQAAVAVLEKAGLTEAALELAKKLKHVPGQVRALARLGRADEARPLAIAAGNELLAGHCSILLGEITAARQHYRRAAETTTLKGRELALLQDRAGNRLEAAKLYEECGEFTFAAECYAMEGQTERAAALLMQGKAQTRWREERGLVPSEEAQSQLRTAALSLKNLGDLLAAAETYREAGELLAAAQCYEVLYDWVRAALLYNQLGMEDEERVARQRAKSSRTGPVSRSKVERPAPTPPPASAKAATAPHEAPTPSLIDRSESLPPPPSPAEAPSVAAAAAPIVPPVPIPPFTPTLPPPAPEKHPRWLPVHQRRDTLVTPTLTLPGGMQGSPVSQDSVRRRNWPQVALQLEQGGMVLAAGDLQLQLGNLAEAAYLFHRGGHPLEAALVSIAAGDYSRAAELLVESLERKVDAGIAALLGEMLVRLDEIELADDVLRRFLAKRIAEQNAPIVYRYARLFEEAGRLDRAADLYRGLIESGATSDTLERRLVSVEQARIRATTPPTLTEAPAAARQRALGAADFLDRLLTDSSEGVPKLDVMTGVATATPIPQRTGKPYQFKAPSSEVAMLGSRPEVATRGALPTIVRQLSLLGRQEDPSESAFPDAQRYTFNRLHGRSAGSQLYDATDRETGERVALRLLHSFDSPAATLRYFLADMRSLVRLRHPAISHVLDVGLMDLQYYVAGEFIEGRDLASMLEVRGKLPAPEALRIVQAVAQGLAAAHDIGVLHRDVTPRNVIIRTNGSVVLTDFAVARILLRHRQLTTFFAPYMAPELAESGESSPAADIYSLGVMLYTLLVGKTPNQVAGIGPGRELVAFQALGGFPTVASQVPGVPPVLDELIVNLTAPDTANRYGRAEEVLPVIEQLLKG